MYISTDHVYVYGAAIIRYGIMHIEHIYHLKQVLISNEKVRTDSNNVEREKRETVSCTKLYYVTRTLPYVTFLSIHIQHEPITTS